MTVKECIDRTDNAKPNGISEESKVRWLSTIDAQIVEEIVKTHELDDRAKLWKDFKGHSTDNLSDELFAEFPYDELYVSYLKMKIDEENGETTRYNNSAIMFNTHLDNFSKNYNKNHMPLGSQIALFGGNAPRF